MMNSTYQDLKGKHVLVTGGTSGIGKEITNGLNYQQVDITLLGRDEHKLKDSMNEFLQIKDLCICDQNQIAQIEKSLEKLHRPFDGIVFSAGIANFLPIKFLKQEKSQEIFNVNFFSNVIILQYLIRKKLLNKNASIVFVSSISQHVAEIGTSIYSSSKAALSAFARNAALELASSQIRVNSISPGLVKTNLLNDEKGVLSTNIIDKNAAQYPLGLGRANDVAALCLFLLSKESSWMTGADIRDRKSVV